MVHHTGTNHDKFTFIPQGGRTVCEIDVVSSGIYKSLFGFFFDVGRELVHQAYRYGAVVGGVGCK